MALKPLLAVAVALAAAWSLDDAQGTFAASPGFSGRSGFTCLVCHQPPSPTNDDAVAILEGLPAAWDVNATYELSVRVEDGPPALPAPAPQGGFDLASDQGRFDILGQETLLRLSSSREVTYEPAGTLMRSWSVAWRAPSLNERPADATFWLAAMAANGNHVVALNRSDLGETFDAVDAIKVVVPPSSAALAAWRDLPLLAPQATYDAANVRIVGSHVDPLAEGLRTIIDGDEGSDRPTGRDFVVDLSGHGPGRREVALQSLGSDRVSPRLVLVVDITGQPPTMEPSSSAARTSSAPALAVLAVAVAAAALHPRKNLP